MNVTFSRAYTYMYSRIKWWDHMHSTFCYRYCSMSRICSVHASYYMFISNRSMSSIMQGMIVVYDKVVFVTANGRSMMLLLLQYDNISSLKYNLIQFHLLYFHMSLMYRVSSSWMTSFQYARVHMNKSGNLAAELNRDAVTTATTTFNTGSHPKNRAETQNLAFFFLSDIIHLLIWSLGTR